MERRAYKNLFIVGIVFMFGFCLSGAAVFAKTKSVRGGELKIKHTVKTMGLPDLKITNLSVHPSNSKTFEEITVKAWVKNIGPSKAKKTFYVKLKYKTGGKSKVLATIPVYGLDPGEKVKCTKKFIPIEQGHYTASVIADSGDDLVEETKNNNVKNRAFEILPGPKPDLIISRINYSPKKPTENDIITFWVFVKNIGPGHSGPSKLQFRIGGNNNVPLVSIPVLPPGKEYRYTKSNLRLRKIQKYRATATADFSSDVIELKENNNIGIENFRVAKGYVPAGVKVSIKAVNWSRSDKTWRAYVKNSGSVAAKVIISAWVLENGEQGMTKHMDARILPNRDVVLIGDYQNFTVPPGTRLYVRVLLKDIGTKLAEETIVLN